MTDTFGLVLRRYRQAAGMTQHALAKLARTDPSWVLRLEAGTRRPSRGMALRLGNALAPALDVDSSALGDTLAVAAGWLPRDLVAYAVRDEPELVEIARVLADPRLSAADAMALRTALWVIVLAARGRGMREAAD